jgi:hypothetical protein
MGGERKPDEAVLFPEVTMDGFTVRPWTLQQAVELAPTLGSLVDIAKESGVVEFLQKLLEDVGGKKGKAGPVETIAGDVMAALPGIIVRVLPYSPKVLAVSLGITEEEVGKFDLAKTTRLLLLIVTFNVDYLKNSFGPGRARERKAG